MHSVGILVVEVVAVVAVLGVLIAFGTGSWTRRGEGWPDPAGLESACKFSGGSRLGEGVMAALVAALAELGVQAVNPDADGIGWGVRATLEGRSAYVHLWRGTGDDDEWILAVEDPSSGGPGAPEIVGAVRRALGTIAALDRITWRPRELVTGTYAELVARRRGRI
jgi:hypothetical protein